MQQAILFFTAFLKLISSKITGHSNSKIGTIYHDTKMGIIRRLVTSKLKIDCLKLAFLMEKSNFRFKHEPAPNLPSSRNFMILGTKITSRNECHNNLSSI